MVNKFFRPILSLLIVTTIIFSTGCASVTRGTHDTLVVDSSPQQALVSVYRLNSTLTESEISKNLPAAKARSILANYKKGNKNYSGPLTGLTPASFVLKRKGNYKVSISKRGYRTATVIVKNKVVGKGAAGVAGNAIVGGVIGLVVDASTGAAKDLSPNPVKVRLNR